MVSMATHNRNEYVGLSLRAWEESEHHTASLYIFDDSSSEYTLADLNKWAPDAQVSGGQGKNRGPDATSRLIVETFVASDYDVLVILDSDLLVANDWFARLLRGLAATEGVLSLYRSQAPKHYSTKCEGGVICKVNSMGNAGAVWRKDLATRMLAEMSNVQGFDWGWSEWCEKNNIPMVSLKESAVLHIGMHGSWSAETSSEKSVEFPIGNLSPYLVEQSSVYLKGKRPGRGKLKL